jgi:tRNA (guanine-N7-)-methyltransferase
VDRKAEDYSSPDANPFVRSHREIGLPLLPADVAATWRGRWDEHFGRRAPLHVEIGSGNGFFLRDMALRHPEWNWLGIEIRYKRTVLCATKLTRANVRNARIARYHAAFLDDLFLPGTLSGLYVNHPDPWPRTSQEKNRLISRWFLEDVARFLVPGAWLRIKSDFRPNVDRVLEVLDHAEDGTPLPRLPFDITGIADDINNGPAPWPDDVMTNYQRKMLVKGVPVAAIQIVRTTAPWPHS